MNSVPANGTLTLSSLDAQGRGSETELAKSSATDVDQTLGRGMGPGGKSVSWHGMAEAVLRGFNGWKMLEKCLPW